MAAPGRARYPSTETGHEPSFRFLAKEEGKEDVELREFDTGKSEEDALRQLNILAGGYKPIKGRADYEKTLKDSQKAERLLADVASVAYDLIHRSEGMSFTTQKLAQFNNKLISLCLNVPDSELKSTIDKIIAQAQEQFLKKYPRENREGFQSIFRGLDKGIASSVKFLKDRQVELEPGKHRKFYFNTQADNFYAVDIIELNYQQENNVVVVEEMNLVQIKSGSRSAEDERRIGEKHQFFLNEFVTSAKEFDKSYLPAIEFKDDDEQLTFNEALAAVQTEIEILGQRFAGGKMSKDEFVVKLVNLIIKSAPTYNDADTKAFQGLSFKDKLWYVGKFIENLRGFILDENISKQLEGLVDPLTEEIEKSGYMPPRATMIKKINSYIWSPGGESLGTERNRGQQLHPRDYTGRHLPPSTIEDPVVIYS